jgi:hypothetical protein
MNIKVDIDMDQVVKLTATVLRQLPYATNNAITRTAKELVDKEKAEITEHLETRTKFAQNRIQILQYSKVNNLSAIVGINPNVKGSALLLGFLIESGGEKTPTSGPNIAEPITGTAARPTFASKIPRRLLYKQLQIVRHVTQTGKIQLKGKQRTFVLPDIGVFQRVGPGPNDINLIYKFAGSAHLRARFKFSKVAQQLIGQRFHLIFAEEFEKEILKKARRGG